MVRQINERLIMDIGVCEGHDSAFYMAKGFQVLGVEADPSAYAGLQETFRDEIQRGDFTLLHRAADTVSGNIVKFKAVPEHPGSGHVSRANPASADQMVDVETISWPDLTQVSGVPYYCKIDIEGSEKHLLQGLVGRPHLLPTYISAEIHSFEPVELLYAAGYRQFKMVNQCNLHLTRQPKQPLEGNPLPDHRWRQSSGPFGRETPGRKWHDFQEMAGLFSLLMEARRRLTVRDWFDVHAWMPE